MKRRSSYEILAIALGGLAPIAVGALLVGLRDSVDNANVALTLVLVVVVAAAAGGRAAGKLVSQRQLLQEVWGPQYESETNYLRLFLAQIRRKLEPNPAQPRYFVTEAGMGYRFEPD